MSENTQEATGYLGQRPWLLYPVPNRQLTQRGPRWGCQATGSPSSMELPASSVPCQSRLHREKAAWVCGSSPPLSCCPGDTFTPKPSMAGSTLWTIQFRFPAEFTSLPHQMQQCTLFPEYSQPFPTSRASLVVFQASAMPFLYSESMTVFVKA